MWKQSTESNIIGVILHSQRAGLRRILSKESIKGRYLTVKLLSCIIVSGEYGEIQIIIKEGI